MGAKSAVLEEGFASIQRVVGQAAPDKKIAAFLLIANEVPKWVDDGRIMLALARDRLYAILRENGIANDQAWEAADKVLKPEPVAKVVSFKGLAPQSSGDWRSNLLRDGEGMLKPRATKNFRWLLARHPEMLGVFSWNAINREVWMSKNPTWGSDDWQPRPLNDDDITSAVHWLETRGLTPKPNEVLAAIQIAAKENPFHPIRDYLNALKWDGVPRLLGGMWEGDTVLPFPVEYFGSPDNPIYAVFVAKWLVSAIARVMKPGCKADCIIVLEGDQARMKSSFLRAIAQINGVNYFNDDLHDIENKDAAIQMTGIWIIEVAELNAFQRKEADAIKSWLSRQTDRYRPPYGKLAIDVPRQWVIAGTLNPAGSGYLRDPTGARRFWPVPVHKAIDIKRVEADRDHMWAEAMHLYQTGYQWHLTEDEVEQAKGVTEDRYEDDPWDALIDRFIVGQSRFTTDEVIRALNIPTAQQTQVTSRRIGRHLRHRGWEKRRASVGGELDYVWTRRE